MRDKTRTATRAAAGLPDPRRAGRRSKGWAPLALAAAGLVSAAGCDDGPICASEIVVLIDEPADGSNVTIDVSPEDGVQIDVPVRSNLRDGDRLTLTVLDAAGQVAATEQATSDAEGNAEFLGVTVPTGPITLEVSGDSHACGAGQDRVAASIGGAGTCALAIREQPLDNPYYDPLEVLASSNDGNPTLPGLQATIDIAAVPGTDVELVVLDIDTATEASAGTERAGDGGRVTFPLTLAEGRQALRAICVASGGAVSQSGTTTVFVDTEAPACALTSPAAGTTIIPAMDIDGDASNGTQIELQAWGGGADVIGESVSFALAGAPVGMVPVGADGSAAVVASFDTPGSFTVDVATQDRAGNTCTISRSHDYQTEGCSIELVAPTPGAVIVADADSDPANGLQAVLEVQVDAQCAGRMVTTDCGEGSSAAVVTGSGLTPIEVTMCAEASCEVTDTCTFAVTSPVGIETSLGAQISADTLAPSVALQLIDPPITCGSAITPEADVDRDASNGVQIDVRVVSPLARTREVEVTSGAGTTRFQAPSSGDVRVTLASGANDLVGLAQDAAGNQGRTDACRVSVFDIVIGFDAALADGLVGRPDFDVNAGALTLDICGSVSAVDASMTVAIDGGTPQPIMATGDRWCLPGVALAESPPAHLIEVTASSGAQTGAAGLALTVDLTPPDPVGDLAAFAPTRQSVELSWTAASDGGAAAAGHVIKVATQVLDETNFDTTGVEVTGPVPGIPGTAHSATLEPARTGASYYVAVAALDAAGNRSVVASVGPVIPDFDASGAVTPVEPDDGENGLGYQMARGDFNGDGYGDLAVSVPFKGAGLGAVYVYLGSLAGLSSAASPDVIIPGTEAGAQLGNSLATIRWNDDAIDDLAVGAPLGNNLSGRVYVFHGGGGFAGITGVGDASMVINGSTRRNDFFRTSGLGWSLARARFDGDARDDLVMSAVYGDGGRGGVAILFGGTTTATDITLSTTNPASNDNAVTLVIRDPDLDTDISDLFGSPVVNLGRTEGPGDPRDDIGVAYDEASSVYVLRGRRRPSGAGVTVVDVDLTTDLRIVNDSASEPAAFGTTMGSIADIDGDGARDIVIGSWLDDDNGSIGRVLIVDGNQVGTLSLPAGLLTEIVPQPDLTGVGSAVANNATAQGLGDVDGDGREDLVLVAGRSTAVTMLVWFGGIIPRGRVTTASAQHRIDAPPTFSAAPTGIGGTPITAIWGGDINGDGLEELCWADWIGNDRDGSFEVLWDDGM